MNSRREERAHRLADEVGRRDARDAETVRDLRGDRRLAGAGRAADQHDDRDVERLQVGEPAQPRDRALALLVAEHLLREHPQPLDVDRRRSPRSARSSSTRRASS